MYIVEYLLENELILRKVSQVSPDQQGKQSHTFDVELHNPLTQLRVCILKGRQERRH